MRWSDISAQTTPPNVLKLNDFSNLPAVQSSLLISKNHADLSRTAVTCQSQDPTLGPTPGPGPDDEKCD